MNEDAANPVLYFDGVCNLCNGAIQFVIKHDPKKRFLFASLQSEAGKKAISQLQASFKNTPDSIILFYNGRFYTQSSAALRTLRLLGGVWVALYAFIIVPKFIRDAVYDLIARKRYKWFGKKDACMIPTPELKERFLS